MHLPPGVFKVQAVVNVLSCEDLLVGLEGFKELEHLCPHAVSLQGPDKAAAVYSVVGLPKFKEDY